MFSRSLSSVLVRLSSESGISKFVCPRYPSKTSILRLGGTPVLTFVYFITAIIQILVLRILSICRIVCQLGPNIKYAMVFLLAAF